MKRWILVTELPAELETVIDQAIIQLTLDHSQALLSGLVVYYKAGSDDVRKSKWTKQQQSAVDKLAVEYFGHLADFDHVLGNQIKDKAVEILKQEGGYAEIKKELITYVNDVFDGNENIIINNIGKKRIEIKLDKDGKLYKVEKEITKEYHTNPRAYADMLSRTSTHKAWELGRADEYKRMGFSKWRFSGPSDERARPWHIALIGQIFEYGTDQSEMALTLLGEPNCRHRAIPYFGSDLDTPQSFYEKQKEKAGVKWDDDVGDWVIAN